MVHINVVRKRRMGKLLLVGVAFLIAVAFLLTGLRQGAASNGQSGVSAPRVTIDVNPGGSKSIDLSSLGDLPVAVFGAKDFDVTSIVPESLNFAGAAMTKAKDSASSSPENDISAGTGGVRFNVAYQDVNKDGITDLVASFPIAFLADLSAGTSLAVLRGRLVDGTPIEGSQTVDATGESPIKKGNANAPGGNGNCAGAITINDNAAASPYPSTINVVGLIGVISNLTVTVTGFSHTFSEDVSVLLVGPTGQKMVLWAEAGGGGASVNANLTFSDAAGAALPNAGGLATGTFKPTNRIGTNIFGETAFPAPAPTSTPASPYSATLASFNNTNPNGTWSLYVVDIAEGDTGSISGGWCLNITTAPSVTTCGPTLLQGAIAAGDPTQVSRLFRDGNAAQCVGAAKVCPGSSGSSTLRYDTYNITNNSGATACVTVTTTSSCGVNVFASAYLTTYTPPPPSGNLCLAYLGDAGLSPQNANGVGGAFAFSLANGATAVLVANEVTANTPCAAYSLLVEGAICAPAGACTITCPNNVTQGNDTGACNALVNYPAPMTTGTCGTVACNPPSGSLFPVGTTTVTCSANGGAGPFCTFTVTVLDNQPPTITCPNPVVQQNDLNQCGAVVTYPPPTVSDNCPGVGTPICAPASGAFFQVGTTTVTCRVSDATACANIFAVDTSDNLVNFRTSAPGSISSKPITGLGVNEDVVGIDFRPATGQLFGLVRDTVTTGLRIVTINVVTGATAQIGAAFSASGTDFGFDFNPTVDRIRITSDAETNLSVNPDTGVVTVQTPLNPGNPNVVGSAYTNNFVGATVTTLYAIDSGTDTLATQNPPANGTLSTVGPLGVDTTGNVGFDISQCGGTAYAVLEPTGNIQSPTGGGSNLYTINLGTGQATLVGFIAGNTIRAMSVEMARTSTCSFTVRVNDTQPPTITCPGTINTAAGVSCPIASNQVVTFNNPPATDNCPGVTVACNPPSGSTFPVGCTTVTCTATDASGNTATCAFQVCVFSFCLQDETNPGNVVLVNVQTGDYIFCCNGVFVASGRGVVTLRGCAGTIEDNKGNRKVELRFDTSVDGNRGNGSATIKIDQGVRCQITDLNMSNNTCTCSNQPPPQSRLEK